MSFWELVVVAVVALVVLGPEKLPGAIRTVTGTIRSIRQFGHQMKSELADELRVHELHEKLRQAEEKGLLGLTTEEMTALAELRHAAAEVTDPYGPSQQPAAITPQATLPAGTQPASISTLNTPTGQSPMAPVVPTPSGTAVTGAAGSQHSTTSTATATQTASTAAITPSVTSSVTSSGPSDQQRHD